MAIANFRLGIRGQILTIAVVPVLIVTLILIFVIWRSDVLHSQQALDRQGRLLAAQLAANLEYALWTGATDQITTAITTTIGPATRVLGTPIGRISVLDQNGQTLFTSEPNPLPAPSALQHLFAWTDAFAGMKTFSADISLDPLNVVDNTSKAQRFLGRVSLDIPLAPIKAEQYQNLLLDAGLVLIVLTAAFATAYWIGRRVSGAIERIAGAIMRIKSGDLEVRVKTDEAAELGTLQEGVNLLVDAISQAKEKLEAELAKVRAEYDVAMDDLRVQTEKAEQANQAKSLFLAKVSHEMRTPLYSIHGLTERLQKTAMGSEVQQDLHHILIASDTLNRTISDIMDFTALEKGKYQLNNTAFSLWDEIERTTETVAMRAYEKGLYLDVIVAPEVPQTVIGDARAFGTIVANLISNAVKFTVIGGVCVRLGVESGQAEQNTVVIQLAVEDTGYGIPADRLDFIFEPFEQVDGKLNRLTEGSGLGLSTVKSYSDLIGGSIKVDSAVGRGSRFTALLPFQKQTAPCEQKTNEDLSGLRALIVDERASFCESVACRLQTLGIDAISNLTPITELCRMASPPVLFDLVVVRDLSDIETPVMLADKVHRWGNSIVTFETRYDCRWRSKPA